MQVFVTLLRRELGGYFSSLTGYVIIAVILFLLGLSFNAILPQLSAEPTDAPATELFFVTVYFWLILLLMPPVITMRSFALEKFSGTYETLMTAPVKDWVVVAAKFGGVFAFYAMAWLPFVAHLLIVRSFSNDAGALDWGVLASTYLGLFLVGAFYVSLGVFASALTRSQIMAAILSCALGLAFFLLSLRAILVARPEGWMGEVFQYISMTEHMEDFARGVVDTRALAFYVSLTAFFLFLTTKVIESRRWK